MFYSTFYSNIVVYASDYFDINQPFSTLIAKKLADKIFHHYKSPLQLAAEQPTHQYQTKNCVGCNILLLMLCGNS